MLSPTLKALTEYSPRAGKWAAYAYVAVSSALVALCVVTLFLERNGLDGGLGTCSNAQDSGALIGFCRYLLLHRGDLMGALMGSGGGGANANVTEL